MIKITKYNHRNRTLKLISFGFLLMTCTYNISSFLSDNKHMKLFKNINFHHTVSFIQLFGQLFVNVAYKNKRRAPPWWFDRRDCYTTSNGRIIQFEKKKKNKKTIAEKADNWTLGTTQTRRRKMGKIRSQNNNVIKCLQYAGEHCRR